MSGLRVAFIALMSTMTLAGCGAADDDTAVAVEAPGVAAPAMSIDESRLPNVVIVLADDLGIGDTGIYGSQVI